jgi:hypothetical protein
VEERPPSRERGREGEVKCAALLSTVQDSTFETLSANDHSEAGKYERPEGEDFDRGLRGGDLGG